MGVSKLFAVAAALVAIFASASGQNITGHIDFNDGNYMLDFVVYNATGDVPSIELTATVNATGWVGIGVNNVANMSNADLYIGGVNGSSNNELYGDDYHGVGNTRPVIDTMQDWERVSVEETGGNTILKVNRKLDTGDAAEDLVIENMNQFVIWAYGENDTIAYHQSQRGAMEYNFLNPS